MKKIASILLSGILLFNGFGHRLILSYLEDQAQHEQEAKLDVDDYNESELISVKVPITHLSYYNPSPTYERVSGSLQVGGIQYQYVKRRLYNDSLEVLCLPDHAAMKWQAAKQKSSHPQVHRIPEETPYVEVAGFSLFAPDICAPSRNRYAFGFIPSPFAADNERPPSRVV